MIWVDPISSNDAFEITNGNKINSRQKLIKISTLVFSRILDQMKSCISIFNRKIDQNFTQAPWHPKKDLKRHWWNILMHLTTRNFYPMVLQLNACNEMHTWPSHLRHEEKCNECLPMYFWFCPIELIWQFSLFEILFKITKNNVRQKNLFHRW